VEIELEEGVFLEMREHVKEMGTTVAHLIKFLVVSFIEESEGGP
jgi:hypothetical protein